MLLTSRKMRALFVFLTKVNYECEKEIKSFIYTHNLISYSKLWECYSQTLHFKDLIRHCVPLKVYYVCNGEGNGTPLQYSCLENPMDGGAWWAAVHGVTEGRKRLSDFTFTFHFHALEKEMATHSSVLAWRIPGTGEPGGLPSLGSHRV